MQSGNCACNCSHKRSVRCITVHLHAKLSSLVNGASNIHCGKGNFLDMIPCIAPPLVARGPKVGVGSRARASRSVLGSLGARMVKRAQPAKQPLPPCCCKIHDKIHFRTWFPPSIPWCFPSPIPPSSPICRRCECKQALVTFCGHGMWSSISCLRVPSMQDVPPMQE